MINIIPFLFTLIISSMVLTPAMGQSRFSIAPTVSAGYRRTDFTFQVPENSPDLRLSSSGSYQSVSAGLITHYGLSSRWSISAGLLYNHLKGNEKIVYYDGNRQGYTQPITQNNLQLPIAVNYTGTSRLSPYVSAGIVLNYTYEVAYTNPVTGAITRVHNKLDGDHAVTTQAMLGAGVRYRFAPGISLIVQPTATYELGRPSSLYPLFRNYNLGVQTQVKFSF